MKVKEEEGEDWKIGLLLLDFFGSYSKPAKRVLVLCPEYSSKREKFRLISSSLARSYSEIYRIGRKKKKKGNFFLPFFLFSFLSQGILYTTYICRLDRTSFLLSLQCIYTLHSIDRPWIAGWNLAWWKIAFQFCRFAYESRGSNVKIHASSKLV